MAKKGMDSTFRKEAVENFSSADLLDQNLVVIKARSWILLLVIVCLIAGVLVWGFWGHIPKQHEGMGIIIERVAPIRLANPTSTGPVVVCNVVPGQVVSAGDILIEIGSPETTAILTEAQKQLDTALLQDLVEWEAEEKSLVKLRESLALRATALEASLEQTRKLIELYREQTALYETLAEERLIPDTQLINARTRFFESEQHEKTTLAQMAELESQLENRLANIAMVRSARTTRVEAARSHVVQARINHELNGVIRAPRELRIMEVMVHEGEFVSRGMDVITAMPVGEPSAGTENNMQVIAFVEFGRGMEIDPGMPVQVAIPFADASQYGFIKGKISDVASYASDLPTVANKVGNQNLASAIVQATSGVPLMLEVDLESDAQTPSGFAWTSAQGFPGAVPHLSACSIKVTTRHERPIDLVLPWFKTLLGIDTPPVSQQKR